MQYPTHIALASAALIALAGISGCDGAAVPAARADSPPAAEEPEPAPAAAPEEETSSAPAEPEKAENPEPELGAELGAFELTYYWMAEERKGALTESLIHYKTCESIAKVPRSFARKLSLEGTGRLLDGRVVNTAGRCRCKTTASSCFFVVAKRKKWGVGVGKKALSPFRTVAVDPRKVAIGTMLYVPQLDGLTVPGRKPWGGFVHDGCVLAGDKGGNIRGAQLDFFMGRKRHYRSFFSRNRIQQVSVFDGKGRCERKNRSVARASRSSI